MIMEGKGKEGIGSAGNGTQPLISIGSGHGVIIIFHSNSTNSLPCFSSRRSHPTHPLTHDISPPLTLRTHRHLPHLATNSAQSSPSYKGLGKQRKLQTVVLSPPLRLPVPTVPSPSPTLSTNFSPRHAFESGRFGNLPLPGAGGIRG